MFFTRWRLLRPNHENTYLEHGGKQTAKAVIKDSNLQEQEMHDRCKRNELAAMRVTSAPEKHQCD